MFREIQARPQISARSEINAWSQISARSAWVKAAATFQWEAMELRDTVQHKLKAVVAAKMKSKEAGI